MQELKTGGPFDARYSRQEGMMIRFNEVGFDLVACAENLTEIELRAWKSGQITVAFFGSRKSVAIWAVKAGSVSFDCPVNFHLIDKQHRTAWLSADFNLISLILLEKRTGRIAAMRAIGLNPDIIEAFKTSMHSQITQHDEGEIYVANIRILNTLSTEQVIAGGQKQTFV